jgi:hypothetical protein
VADENRFGQFRTSLVTASGECYRRVTDAGPLRGCAPDGSAVFLPWSALTGVRETGRLFLLLDLQDRHVRGFIPKASPGDLPPDAELGDFIRERITAATSR